MEHDDASRAGSNAGGGGTPVSGWYPDPKGSGLLRRWDGTAWTDELRPPQAAGTDSDADPGGTIPPVGDEAVPGEPHEPRGARSIRFDPRLVVGVVALVVVLALAVGLLSRGGGGATLDGIALPAVAAAGKEYTESWREAADEFQSAAVVDDALVMTQGEWRGDRFDGELVAFDLADGSERYAVDLDGDYGSVWVRGSDQMLFAQGDGDSVFRVFEPDGTEAWSESYREDWFSAMLMDDQRVLISLWDLEEIEVLQLSDGERLWDADGRPIGFEGDTVVVHDGDELIAYDAAGAERWVHDIDAEDFQTGHVGAGRVVYVDDDTVVSLSLDDGSEQWSDRTDHRDGVWGVEIIDSVGILVRGPDGTEMWSFDGTLSWDDRDALNGTGLHIDGQPAMVVVDDASGRAELYDMTSGRRMSRARFPRDAWTTSGTYLPSGDHVVANALLLKDDEEVLALALDDGFEEMWTLDAGDPVAGVYVADDGIVVVTQDPDDGDIELAFFR